MMKKSMLKALLSKTLCLFVMLTVSIASLAQNKYYVSSAGNDANSGSISSPWRTIAKVNSSWSIIQPGDTIFLRGGDTFRETLTIGKSGTSLNRIVIASYGSGKALISGYNTITGFSLTSGSVYQASFPQGKAQLINVEINGRQAQIGRTPNDDQTPYYFESYSGSTSITDNQLTSSPSWTGAEVVIRKSHWAFDRAKVTNHNGTLVQYGLTGFTLGGSSQSLWIPDRSGYGFWFQNSLQTLDKEGEWYYNPSTQILYFHTGSKTPTEFVVRASARDTGININNKTYITIDGVNVEGTNISGIHAINTDHLIIKNCTITNNVVGILFRNVGNTTVEDNIVDHALTSGIVVESPSKSNVTVQRNTVDNVYLIAGMGDYSNDAIGLRSIRVNANNNTIRRNFLKNTGYSGINFQGNNVLIEENRVDSFCLTQEDNGAIYVYSGPQTYSPASPVYTNRVIRKNIITNAVGNLYAMPVGSLIDLAGIYFDGKSMNAVVLDNYLENIPGPAVYSNNGVNIRVTGNLCKNVRNGSKLNLYRWGSTSGFVYTSNVLIPGSITDELFEHSFDSLRFSTPGEQVGSFFYLDSNRFYGTSHTPFGVSQLANMSLSAWQLSTNEDLNTQMIPVARQYTITGVISANRVSNPSFTTNITGWTAFGSTGTWDNTNQINGGSIRLTFTTTTIGSYGFIHSSIGSVTSGQIYRLRVKTKGTTQNGVLRVYFRKTASPYNDISTNQFSTFGLDIKQHEFYIEPTTETASIVLSIERTSGEVYIDDIELVQVSGSRNNVTDSVITRFATNSTLSISLPGKYRDAFGNQYNGSDVLQPWTSKAYFYSGPVDVVTPCTFTYGKWSNCNSGIQTRPYVSSPLGCVGTPPIDSIQRSCVLEIPCTFTYGSWSSCVNGTQTRSYTSNPSGCIGTPPQDSLTRSCIVPCTFTYGSWSICGSNGIQTRTYTSAPSGCGGVPPIDSIQRTCTPPCSFTYGSWSTCNNGTQTRPYSASPSGCAGVPPTDSITRSCTVPCTFTYGSWSATCVNNLQTRTYTASPSWCTGLPPTDSIQRVCQPCTFTYSAWSTCTNGFQTRTATRSPSNCVGTPPADSLRRTCTSVTISSFSYDSRRTRIYIKCNVTGTMIIRNAATGATVQTSNYVAGGVNISVSGLTRGIRYTATTYGRSLTFTR